MVSWAIPKLDVDPNVSSVQSVKPMKRVLINDVKILVQVPVESMPNVPSSTILQSAPVLNPTVEIHSRFARKLTIIVRFYH